MLIHGRNDRTNMPDLRASVTSIEAPGLGVGLTRAKCADRLLSNSMVCLGSRKRAELMAPFRRVAFSTTGRLVGCGVLIAAPWMLTLFGSRRLR